METTGLQKFLKRPLAGLGSLFVSARCRSRRRQCIVLLIVFLLYRLVWVQDLDDEATTTSSSSMFLQTKPTRIQETTLLPPPPTVATTAATTTATTTATTATATTTSSILQPPQSILYPEQSFDTVYDQVYAKHDPETTLRWVGMGGKDKQARTFKTFFRQGFKGAPLCDNIRQHWNTHKRNVTLIHFKTECISLFRRMGSGTGNIINTILNARLQARVLGIDFMFTCKDAKDTAVNTIIPTPWMTGYFPATTSTNQLVASNLVESSEEVCVVFNDVPIGHLVAEFQYELRRMTLALVGLPPQHHSTYKAARDFQQTFVQTEQSPNNNVLQLHKMNHGPPFSNNPVYKNFVPDDVAIHFRCGDLASNAHAMYGLLPFVYYSRDISTAARSIGILTSPFEKSQFNRDETRYSDKCRILTHGMVDYLQQHFPQATVSVHNQPNETLALSYARLVMANQSFVSISTFGVFPAAATFGTGYFYKCPPDFECSAKWTSIQPGLDRLTDNVVLSTIPRISALAVRDHWNDGDGNGSAILKWLTNDSVTQDWLV